MRAGHEVRLWPGAAVGWQQALRSKGELDVTEGGREREGERNKAEILRNILKEYFEELYNCNGVCHIFEFEQL